MKIGIVSLLIIMIGFIFCSNKKEQKKAQTSLITIEKFPQNLAQKISEAKTFCTAKKYNQNICFLADLSIHSGLKRFYVIDLQTQKAIDSFMVGHGCGKNNWGKDDSKTNPQFSNLEESHCSSLGKYKIGTRAYSDWGVHTKYLLHGLEASNSNAQKRYIVFHSWELVTNNEVYPNGTLEGWGCPTLSNQHFKKCDSIIKQQTKPMLLWLYK